MNFTISEALLQFQMSIVFEILYKTAEVVLLLNNIRGFLGKDFAFIVIYIVSVGLITPYLIKILLHEIGCSAYSLLHFLLVFNSVNPQPLWLCRTVEL